MKQQKWLVVAPIVVVALGMLGYVFGEGYSVYLALLSSLKLLKIHLDPLPPNPALEIARWIGIVFLFSLVYSAVIAVIEKNKLWLRSRKKDAVSVHGDGVYVEQLLASLGRRGVHSDQRLSFKAPTQVIMFDDDDKTVSFYQSHSKELEKAKAVHLCLALGSHVSVEQSNVYILNISEVKAISYWRENYSKGDESFAIIGEGQLAEAILYWGLLTNVADVNNQIKYYVYGNYDRFLSLHNDLSNMIRNYGNDQIEFINGEWYSNKDQLQNVDRVILCGNTRENIEIATSMCDAGIASSIHVFTDNKNISSLLDTDKCTLVGTISNANIENIMLMDDVHESGKLCHATYMLGEKSDEQVLTKTVVREYLKSDEFYSGYSKQSNDNGITKDYSVGGWNNTNAFTRGSNYATAIHDVQKYSLLCEMGIDVKGMTEEENADAFDSLDQAAKDRLQEIEHIRWCRYHFLSNWCPVDQTHSLPEGLAKDSSRRIHSCLIPYNQLSEKDKNKDGYFYRTLSLRI